MNRPLETDSKVVRVFRYIRRPPTAYYSNLGGIAFLFEFTNGDSDDKLKFSYALCSQEDNFDKNHGRNLATTRMEHGEFTQIDYDRGQSLVHNVHSYLTRKYIKNQMTQTEHSLYYNMMTGCM
jgi:hypothetical protein